MSGAALDAAVVGAEADVEGLLAVGVFFDPLPDVALTIATGERRIYANLLLTVGVVR